MPAPASEATLLFDARCRSCAWFAAAVRSLDTGGAITFTPLDDPAARDRLAPALGTSYGSAFHLVDERTGSVRSGEDALLALARLLPAVRPLAEAVRRVPGLRAAPRELYRFLAAARACRVDVPAPPV